MGRAAHREDARLKVARIAARLFLEKGVAETSGDEIAAAAGLSTRTVWRYFRSKESCVEPLFNVSTLRFAEKLRRWPRSASIEEVIHSSIGPEHQSAEEIADDVLVALLISRLPEEAALRASWLISCHLGEQQWLALIADRLGRAASDFDVRLCAATVAAAVRIIDETVSLAVIRHGLKTTTAEINDQLAAAIRKASTLPFCDPVPLQLWSGEPARPPGTREPG